MMSKTISLLALVAFATAASKPTSDQCYCPISGQLYLCEAPKPCGAPNAAGFVQCCVPGDVCGANGFCHFTHPQSGASGYYMAGCTDPTFRDSACPINCAGEPTQDVVYNSSTKEWACCYNDGGPLDCANPGGDTFKAPSPQQLFAAPFSQLTATASASSTGIALSSAAATSSSSNSSTKAQHNTPSAAATSSVSSSNGTAHGPTDTTHSASGPSPTSSSSQPASTVKSDASQAFFSLFSVGLAVTAALL